jgi:hypothetical protein
MRARAPVGPPPEADTAGEWFEVRDASGELLTHGLLHDLMPQTAEVFGDEPGEPIYRVPISRPSGEFELIVPDLPGAARFTLHGLVRRAAAGAEAAGPSALVLDYDFTELRRMDVNQPEGGESGGAAS